MLLDLFNLFADFLPLHLYIPKIPDSLELLHPPYLDLLLLCEEGCLGLGLAREGLKKSGFFKFKNPGWQTVHLTSEMEFLDLNLEKT